MAISQKRLITDTNYVARLDGFQVVETGRHQGQKVFEQNRFPAENNDCEMASGQVLLVLETSIYCQQYVEFRGFCLFQKFTVLKSCESGPLQHTQRSREWNIPA